MNTPRRYAVILLDNYAATQIRRLTTDMDGQVFAQSTEKTQWIGDFQEETAIYWCNDEGTCRALVNTLTQLFPRNSYCISKINDVFHVPQTPAVHARFTEQGLIPA